MGVIIMGKIESGCCRVGDRCVIMPNRTRVEVTNIYYEEIETDSCVCGENVRLKLKNVEEEVRIPISLSSSIDSLSRKSRQDLFSAILNKIHVESDEYSMLK